MIQSYDARTTAQALIPHVPKTVITLIRKLHTAGFEAYIIGGAVRDLIMRRATDDFDIATNARPETIRKLFIRTIPTGIQHGTITVLLNTMSFEVTTYRADGLYSDGRHPDSVEYSDTLSEDLSRRDFTINALALDPINAVLIDEHNGQNDIQAHSIRCIGDPNTRFSEDGLRLLRACRFAAVLDFSIDDTTLSAMEHCYEKARTVSYERVQEEIKKMMKAHRPSVGIEYMRRTGLLDIYLPELAATVDVRQNRFHKYDVYYHSLYTCDAAPQAMPLLRIAALFHDIGKPRTKRISDVLSMQEKEALQAQGQQTGNGDATFYNHEVVGARLARTILRRLKFSNQEIELITKLIRLHMFYYTRDWTDGAVRRFMRRAGLDTIPLLFELREADRIGNGTKRGRSGALRELQRRIDKVIEEENAFSLKHLAVNGTDIMNYKHIPPSPQVGRVLNYILELVLDEPELNTREALLALVEKLDIDSIPDMKNNTSNN